MVARRDRFEHDVGGQHKTDPGKEQPATADTIPKGLRYRVGSLEVVKATAYMVVPIMSGILRRLMVALSLLAFVSGMTVQVLPSAQALGLNMAERGANGDPERPRMAMDHPGDSMPVPLPCKGVMLDCVKQMGCLGTPALPDRSASVSVPIAYSIVAYWAPGSALLGRNVEPEVFPPIAG